VVALCQGGQGNGTGDEVPRGRKPVTTGRERERGNETEKKAGRLRT
jgi:hypothetical protein